MQTMSIHESGQKSRGGVRMKENDWGEGGSKNFPWLLYTGRFECVFFFLFPSFWDVPHKLF